MAAPAKAISSMMVIPDLTAMAQPEAALTTAFDFRQHSASQQV